jgi:hypothetical protein
LTVAGAASAAVAGKTTNTNTASFFREGIKISPERGRSRLCEQGSSRFSRTGKFLATKRSIELNYLATQQTFIAFQQVSSNHGAIAVSAISPCGHLIVSLAYS